MSYSDRIRQAADPREAMEIIAEGLDQIVDALAAGTLSNKGSDGWGSWGGREAAGMPPEAAPSPHPPVDESAIEDAMSAAEEFYAVRQAPINLDEVDRAQSRVDSWQERVDKSPTPQNIAMLEQAERALEKAMTPGEYLDNSGIVEGRGDTSTAVEDDQGRWIVELPPASPERKAARRALAESLDLPGFFPPIFRSTAEAAESIVHGYEVGGPRWLYANRILPDGQDLFNALPPAAKTVMVQDIALDDQREAWEFQRDIMKTEDVEGGTLGIAMDNIDGVGAGPGTPLRGQD